MSLSFDATNGKPRRRVMTVFGTRPEIIKLAPVIHAIETRSKEFDSIVVCSGQHTDLLEPFVAIFDWLAAQLVQLLGMVAESLSEIIIIRLDETGTTGWSAKPAEAAAAASASAIVQERMVEILSSRGESSIVLGDFIGPVGRSGKREWRFRVWRLVPAVGWGRMCRLCGHRIDEMGVHPVKRGLCYTP